MTGYTLGTVPFRTVYLHGTVRDAQGRKMSKSLGNGIDPIEIAQKFGADAGRMALVVGNTPGTDSRISEDKVKAYKHFSNKIWNATRFVLTNSDDVAIDTERPILTPRDEAIMTELAATVLSITTHLDNLRLHLASEELYHYFWHTFADVIIEEMKPRLNGSDVDSKKAAQWVLLQVLATNLTMLHPFIPFITEELWSMLPKENKSLLIIEPWPTLL